MRRSWQAKGLAGLGFRGIRFRGIGVCRVQGFRVHNPFLGVQTVRVKVLWCLYRGPLFPETPTSSSGIWQLWISMKVVQGLDLGLEV